ncbi:MAG: glycoside hydrolase family 3 C-terminal domain-containing protein [Lachnospiraceae bacterium]|nr:glycoside hydrolase family 3 C-terminal domain-containing protein [Lachnospiraceae bacterium]
MKRDFRKEAEQLVAQMTVKEAAEQLLYNAPALERLGIPAYNYWNEGLHGTARSGTATVFPQAIGLAAMFDDEFLQRIADVIGTETRAKYNESRKHEDRDIYKGITLWSPNINLFRDQRWGRGQETYGEDPYLTSRMGVAFIRGLQGEGKYLKTAACAKHFAVHSGPESLRHGFDAKASEKDLEETYLPAFKAAVVEADVESVMGAYNRTNGEVCCGSEYLLQKRLRGEWKFDGHVVSDFLAIRDFHENHKVTERPEESCRLALKNGCNLNAGDTYKSLYAAYEEGLVSEEEIREAAIRVFTTRYRLGMFANDCEYDKLDLEDVDTEAHRKLSYEASCRSVVMLKNDGILPLDRSRVKTIGIIGPTATSIEVLNGNYNGVSSEYITNLDGIRAAAGEGVRVMYSEGCHLFRERVQPLAQPEDRISEALAVAEHSDVVILCLGLDATIEGEEGDTGNAFAAGDKESLYLPASQRRLFEALSGTDTPIVLVINTGSAMDVSREQERCSAVLQCWYSGAFGGKALGDILFGKVSPGGKLPVTVSYEGDLPEFTDYSMKNRTYRYTQSEPLYPFGYGLSYSSFTFDALRCEAVDGGYRVELEVANCGECDADEVAEIYVSNEIEEKLSNGKNAEFATAIDPGNQPRWSLAAFRRVSLKKGEKKTVTLTLSDSAFDTVLEDGRRVRLAGTYRIYAGGQQPGRRSEELSGKKCLETQLVL